MKIVKVNQDVSIFFSDGSTINKSMTDEQFNEIRNATEEEIKTILCPKYAEAIKESKEIKSLEDRIENSSLLIKKGDSIYWEEVSELSMPKELVSAILDAEESQNTEELTAYKNFWVLMSLNPDSRCRQNLFWFLKKYGMVISEYGLFVGYRNADIKQKGLEEEKYSKELINYVESKYSQVKNQKKSPKKYLVEYNNKEGWKAIKRDIDVSESMFCLYTLYTYFKERNFDYDLINPDTETVYTDHHSHTFTIKIGEKVSMDRKKCDSVQENTCSRGLHIGGASWLSENYYGDTGLICLINPADVVAVPPYDNYGKLRTCAYLPIGIVKYDDNGKVIPYDLSNGFKSEYVKNIIYDGDKYTEDIAAYSYTTDIPELNSNLVSKNLRDIAQQAIKNKVQ